MNYRHAYHAGNHTEVFKHAVLVMLLQHLLIKPQPFGVLDTHSGLGIYDLTSTQSLKTGEKALGAEKVLGAKLSTALGYLEILRSLNQDELKVYPGSPEIIRLLLRSGDRLVACELHPEDADLLGDRYRFDRRVQTLAQDGYLAINALLPLQERRGLVFIDPPFEDNDEVDKMIKALSLGLKKWATGIFCLWYPIKDPTIGDALAAAARNAGHPKALRAEFVPFKMDGERLAGSGLLICNAPWKIDEKIRVLCKELKPVIGNDSSRWSVAWIT